MAETFSRSFPPVADPSARILILGSLPGAESLRRGQYYAHPQNAFWRLIGAVIGVELARLDYDSRLERLTAAGIALWDVVARARRRGSLDADIRDAQATDLVRLTRALPLLQAVGFNGGKASALGRRQLGPVADGLTLVDLPSSSPAHTRPFAEKLERWMALRRFLEEEGAARKQAGLPPGG